MQTLGELVGDQPLLDSSVFRLVERLQEMNEKEGYVRYGIKIRVLGSYWWFGCIFEDCMCLVRDEYKMQESVWYEMSECDARYEYIGISGYMWYLIRDGMLGSGICEIG